MGVDFSSRNNFLNLGYFAKVFVPDKNYNSLLQVTYFHRLQALLLYVQSLGFPQTDYEIIANFPRRKISELAPDKTLEECNFQKQETFYIQER